MYNDSNSVRNLSPYQLSIREWAIKNRITNVVTLQTLTDSDEGLTLETSAFESLYGAVDKTKLSRYTSVPPTQHHSFFGNLPLFTWLLALKKRSHSTLKENNVGCRGIRIYFNRDISQELGSQAVTTGLDFHLWSVELKEKGSPFKRKHSSKDVFYGNISYSLFEC